MLVPDAGQVKNYSIGSRSLWLILCLCIALLVFGAWGVYSVFQSKLLLTELENSQQYLQNVRQRQHDDHLEMQKNINAEQEKLAVYARQLGQMQASVLRLDVLGQRLVKVTKLPKNEFNFGTPPAMGGLNTEAEGFIVLDLDHQMQSMYKKLTRLDVQLSAVDVILQDKREEKLARPHAWPTEGGWLSSSYGMRIDPFTGKMARHKGVDIANRFGSSVLSANRGVVVFSGKMSAYGSMVEVDHGYGYRTRYGHLSSVLVKAGDQVSDHQLIGRVGSSGHSTGPHLHFEVLRYHQRVNPKPFLPRG